MSDSIRISPKHGLNPCIPVCAFCGEEKNEIAILGMLKNDVEAPRNAVIDYTPCDKCKENWSKGVALIKVTTKAPAKDVLPLTEKDGVKLYLMSGYHVVTQEAAKRLFNIDAKLGTPILLDEKVFDQFTENAKSSGVLDKEGNVVQ